MFEKEAEERVKDYIIELFDCLMQPCKTLEDCQNKELDFDQVVKLVKDSIEFGYNKANEWHYVKDGDLPKDDKQYLVLFSYNYKGKQEMSCGVRDNLHSDFEINRCYTEQIIAWKEIVLPKRRVNK
jgi:hypothetical protein